MNWWSRNKKVLLRILGGLFVLAILVVIFLMVSGPLIPANMCTLVGCIGGIEVEVVGLPESTPFEINLTLPSGETQTLKCGGEIDESIPFEKTCSSKGAFFSLPSDSEPPEVITVTVTTSAGQWTETIFPEYAEFLPNGEDCPPICYNADIIINIAE